MTDSPVLPQYRYRGSVAPSAEVSRPVRAYRNTAAAAAGGASSAPSSATLDIFDVIDSYGGWWGISARDVDAALAQVGDVDTLYVRVNSPGGEATEGVAIANLLRAHPATIRTTVYGIAASAASVIAVAGDSVSMAPGSTLMVHEPSGFAMGGGDDMRSAAQMLDALCDSYASLYALKAGAADWRAIMRAATWYTPAAALEAKLVDRVGLDPQMPADLPPVEDDTEDDPDVVIEIDIEVSPAARAAARRFDLSMLPNAPAALAPKTPAEPPVVPPTETKEADAMSDTLIQGLRERFDLADDADEATVLAKADELLEQATAPGPNAEITDEAIAKARGVTAEQVKAALEGAQKGKVTVSQAKLDELEANAKLGAEARGKQLEQERDEAIAKAFSDGKISADRREAWATAWDKDPEGTKADLESLPARFPVAALPGYAGGENTDADDQLFGKFFPQTQEA